MSVKFLHLSMLTSNRQTARGCRFYVHLVLANKTLHAVFARPILNKVLVPYLQLNSIETHTNKLTNHLALHCIHRFYI